MEEKEFQPLLNDMDEERRIKFPEASPEGRPIYSWHEKYSRCCRNITILKVLSHFSYSMYIERSSSFALKI
jgi:hypothetical protein